MTSIEIEISDESNESDELSENVDEFIHVDRSKKVHWVDDSWGGITSEAMKVTAPSTTPSK